MNPHLPDITHPNITHPNITHPNITQPREFSDPLTQFAMAGYDTWPFLIAVCHAINTLIYRVVDQNSLLSSVVQRGAVLQNLATHEPVIVSLYHATQFQHRDLRNIQAKIATMQQTLADSGAIVDGAMADGQSGAAYAVCVGLLLRIDELLLMIDTSNQLVTRIASLSGLSLTSQVGADSAAPIKDRARAGTHLSEPLGTIIPFRRPIRKPLGPA